ncbi:multidrug effflux MFS transporter [Alicyclobacillus sp. SO9]|uniref:multidrug effflux MFS transporter n=1 Tax=Alicyclobacillus sp. SO9 TaxID=2665646 RepID=UPI0018E7C0CB|nr:multidrug effflux MFS transporter [Alicyclobacillus sp. SO9]QQE79860.1 multidrug effflux MFS transporter [Alicyclobacillus sp. SO9]
MKNSTTVTTREGRGSRSGGSGQAPQTKGKRIWLISLLGALTALGPLSIDMYLPALPTLTRDLHTSTSLGQLSLTFCLLGLAFGQLLAGPISDARGRRGPLIVGLGLYIVAALLCALTPSVWVLILLRLIQGLAGSTGIVIARAILRDYFSGPELTKFFALLMLVNGIAPILAPILGGQLLLLASWRIVFLVLAGLGILMLVSVTLGLPESLPNSRRSVGGFRQTLKTMKDLVTDRVFTGYAFSQGLVFGAMFAYISGSPFVLQQIFGLSPQMFSVVFAMNGTGIIIASQVSAGLSRRYSETAVLRGSLAAAGAGSLLLVVTAAGRGNLAGILVSLFIVVSSVGAVATTGSALAMERKGRHAGSASAVIGMSQLILGAAAAPVVGLFGNTTAAPMGIVIAVLDIGAVLLFLVLVRGYRPARNS